MYFNPSRYTALGSALASPAEREHFPNAKLVLWHQQLADGLAWPWSAAGSLAFLAGEPDKSSVESVALAYSGHQFGQFNPSLGDGRAHLLAQLDTPLGWFDLQSKGSGATRFSRGGDGLCALGPAVREFVMSQAMAALGVPTTHCLGVISTGQMVYRQGAEQGAVVFRLATSHIRVGSFQYLALLQDEGALWQLLELAIKTHYPEIDATGSQRVLAFFKHVCERQIKLIIHWLRVGFIHGVMNTDNTLISGDTIDYGPCAMMEGYDLNTVFSSIDRNGRYAFGQQANIASWNCARLAECLIPLLGDDEQQAVTELSAVLAQFATQFHHEYEKMWCDKLGLMPDNATHQQLLVEFKTLLTEHKFDYTNTFAALTCLLANGHASPFALPVQLNDWCERWLAAIETQTALAIMRTSNPAIIPRNHLVEHFIAEAKQGRYEELEVWLKALSSPYHYEQLDSRYITPDPNAGAGYQTFCGT